MGDDLKPNVVYGAPVAGRRSVTIQFPVKHLARGADEQSSIWQAEIPITLEEDVKIDRVWAFLGVDQGNAGEFAIDLHVEGLRVYQQSLHKEATHGIYDAWDYKDVKPITVPRGTGLSIHLLGHPTGSDGNVQFEFILEG